MPASRLAFAAYARDLDAHNDTRERLVKASRDVTILSKKIIFLLHRLVQDSAADALPAARDKLRDVQALFAAMRPDLAGDSFWRYHRSVSPGLQEYIEALSFAHYLQFSTLISYEDVQASLTADDGVPVRLRCRYSRSSRAHPLCSTLPFPWKIISSALPISPES